MLSFAYEARDAAGNMTSGIQDAPDEQDAVHSLMERGLVVLSIKQQLLKKRNRPEKPLKDSELVLFARQLATMVEAGLPLLNALGGLHRQANPRRQARLRLVLGKLINSVENGESFNEAVSKFPRIFNRLFASMIRAGEIGGNLAHILDRLANYYETSSRLRKKIRSAMTYPVAVICISMAITTFLIMKVVPIFSKIFEDFHHALPVPTQMLINLSAFMREEWLYLVIGLAAVVFGVRYFLRTKRGSELWDICKLNLPVFGPLAHLICMTRFARTFAQLIRSGVPILEVMDIVGDTSGNYMVAIALKSARADVENGEHFTDALTKHPIFPAMMLQMVGAGEATGNIDVMLEKMADFWDAEIETTLDALTSLIEPLLITMLGIVIGGIVIAMFLPIFKLNDIVSDPSGSGS